MDMKNELLRQGRELFNACCKEIYFTEHQAANKLINDIENYPHAFILGCIADRQVKSERAWFVPYFLSQQLNTFEFKELISLTEDDFKKYLRTCGHRLWRQIAGYYHQAIKHIKDNYNENAAEIWNKNPSSAEVIYRLLQFQGIGPKIATMAANILAREFKVPMNDYTSIDISVDRHVKRVFERLELVPHNCSIEQIIYKARAINPEFPGILDYPCFNIGRTYCRINNPNCSDCPISKVCPSKT